MRKTNKKMESGEWIGAAHLSGSALVELLAIRLSEQTTLAKSLVMRVSVVSGKWSGAARLSGEWEVERRCAPQ
jgi:hypothetical protein